MISRKRRVLIGNLIWGEDVVPNFHLGHLLLPLMGVLCVLGAFVVVYTMAKVIKLLMIITKLVLNK